jgi:hypothetical protein
MIFIDNKYTKWYFAIIEHAKIYPSEIFEKHHIIPKSLNGTNDRENLIMLSFRQHFICHKLLTKMLEDRDSKRKMVYALHMMSLKTKNHCRTSKSYEYTRKLRRELGVSDLTKQKMSQSMIGKNVGKIASLETRAKLSIAFKGRIVSDETKKKISKRVQKEWHTGIRDHSIQKSLETRKKNGIWVPPMSGKKHSEETRKKMSASAKLVKRSSPSPETLKKRSIAIKSLRWVSNQQTSRRVKEPLLSSLLEAGWKLGKVNDACRNL